MSHLLACRPEPTRASQPMSMMCSPTTDQLCASTTTLTFALDKGHGRKKGFQCQITEGERPDDGRLGTSTPEGIERSDGLRGGVVRALDIMQTVWNVISRSC